MKLVELLARELKEWPSSQGYAWQDYDKEVRFSHTVDDDFFASAMCSDYVREDGMLNPKAGVTREMWEVERAKLHTPSGRAEELITQLEAEIVKRDARIAELEAELETTLVDWGTLRLELAALKAQPSTVVVLPERWSVPRPIWKDVSQPYGNPLNHADIEAAEKFNLALDEVARLNPCRAVAVPDGYVMVPVEPTAAMIGAVFPLTGESEAMRTRVNIRALNWYRAMLAAAQQKESDDE